MPAMRSLSNKNQNVNKKNSRRKIMENNLYECGIDEVGRGSLSGPLVISAVLLPANLTNKLLRDSKVMNEDERNKAYSWITMNCMHSVVFIGVHTINKINIYEATKYGMKKAFIQLIEKYSINISQVTSLVTDAVPIILPSSYTHKNLSIINPPHAESLYPAVAAASIIAKVTRDALMKKLARVFPLFSIEKHKGYGAAVHIDAIRRHGPSIIHRRSFLSKIVTMENQYGSQQSFF
jgi:ribonuclease HII